MSHKYDNLRKLLHDACMLKAIEDLKKFPSDEEIAKIHEFSPEFIRNMAKMMDDIFQGKTKPDIVAIKKRRIEMLKKVSAAAAVSIAFTFSAAMSVTAVRETFVKMLVSVVGDDFFNVKIKPTDTVNMYISEYRAPEYVPQDYTIAKTVKKNTCYKIIYKNNDDLIKFVQNPLSHLSDLLLDYKENESITIEIDGFSRIFYSPDKNTLILADEEYCYIIQADLDLEELVKISKSISVVGDFVNQ